LEGARIGVGIRRMLGGAPQPLHSFGTFSTTPERRRGREGPADVFFVVVSRGRNRRHHEGSPAGSITTPMVVVVLVFRRRDQYHPPPCRIESPLRALPSLFRFWQARAAPIRMSRRHRPFPWRARNS